MWGTSAFVSDRRFDKPEGRGLTATRSRTLAQELRTPLGEDAVLDEVPASYLADATICATPSGPAWRRRECPSGRFRSGWAIGTSRRR